ncbi:MAG: peptidoglycan DD-metalloendopeptidase family protein [Candidatus Accumulibacter sp.]|jgi:septal ring factor EnvC (AmiA/AmiB activator)|nr:peptidoglycan DD-metalloendopeptidase family protein [Accumulibacter sp.]
MTVIFAGAKRLVTGLSSVLCLLSSVLAAPASAREDAPVSPTRAEVSEKRSDLIELRAQIESLRKEMAAAEGQRVSAADQVKDVEREISTTQRELRALSGQKSRLQTTLKDLGQQARELAERLDELQAQMESLVYRRYLQGQPDALRLLLNGEDPNQMARDLYYLGVIARARQQLQSETRSLLEQKQTLSETMRERAGELSSVEARQKGQHARLLAQRAQRKEVLARISSKIAQQRKEIGNLQRDEQALARLIVRLDRIIAAQAEARRQGAAKTAPGARAPAPESASGTVNEHTPEALPDGQFAALKGRLRLPVRGTVTNRYGGARQEGSTWKGLFIRAAQGSEVKAIAGGRVVFADWMRGFGNLMIVDHGGSYLSVYAYNDAMLKQVGDEVRGGDSIAAAGNSGGNPESGLYFELRHQGLPVDPMKWVSLK